MDENQQFINDIIADMSIVLQKQELLYLKNSLIKELKHVSVSKKTQLARLNNYDENERLYRTFIASKRFEGASEKTITYYLYETKRLVSRIDKNIPDIKTTDIQYYLSEYASTHNISKRSIDNMRKSINGFFLWAYTNKYIQENPLAPIKPIIYDKKPIEILNEDEIFAIREEARKNIRTRAVVELLLATGIRVSELIAINMEDINFEKKEITIHCAKKRGKTDRIIFLSTEARKCMSDYLLYRLKFTSPDTQAFFIANRNNGKRCTERIINTTLRSIEKKIGLRKTLTVHTFRRTLASQLYAKGMKPLDIAYILGHADSRMSETYYINVRQEDVKTNYFRYH